MFAGPTTACVAGWVLYTHIFPLNSLLPSEVLILIPVLKVKRLKPEL